MRKFLEIGFESIIYCIIFIVLVILIDHSHCKEIKKCEKEKRFLETKVQYLEQENIILRNKLNEVNDISYKIITSTVNEIDLLKTDNQNLTKRVNDLV